MSAARQAAEAFFTEAPRPPASAPAPAVVVRKRRAVHPDAEPLHVKETSGDVSEARGPKVYRIDPVSSAAPTADASELLASPSEPASPDEVPLRKRRRRLREDQRPSPATVIRQMQEADAQGERYSPQQRAALKGSMQTLEAALAKVERLKSLDFTIEPLHDEWSRLSIRAEELLKALREAGRQIRLPSFIA